MSNLFAIKNHYQISLTNAWNMIDWDLVKNLSDDLKSAWKSGKQVFICGNGGSATNANHLANDFLYGISPKDGKGPKLFPRLPITKQL